MPKQAIKKTLVYAGVFNYPLSFWQLGTYLISKADVTFEDFTATLNSLVSHEHIAKKKGKYSLDAGSLVDWEERYKSSQKHLIVAQKVTKILEKIPWIKLLAVTGSVAAFNAAPKDDIDIFIITPKNRLWLTRFFVVLLLKAFNLYRTEQCPSGRICPNIYISTAALTWPKNKRNLYIAREILCMHPLINRDDMYFKFIKRNKWIFKYFKSANFSFPEHFFYTSAPRSLVLDLFERFLMRLQLFYMKKQPGEVLSKKIIHFNDLDSTKKVLESYKNTLKNCKSW